MTEPMSAKEPRRAFTVQHRLEDAEADFISAVYRFREAEANSSAFYAEARVAMNKAEAQLYSIRQSLYRGTTGLEEIDAPLVNIFSKSVCPEPAWI